jgi:hypothetical protein
VTTLLARSAKQDCRWLWATLEIQAANAYLLAEITHANRRDTFWQAGGWRFWEASKDCI